MTTQGDTLGTFEPGESKTLAFSFTPSTLSESPENLVASYQIQLDVQGSYQSPLPSFDVEGSSQIKPNANLHAIGSDESTAALLTDGTSVVNVDLEM